MRPDLNIKGGVSFRTEFSWEELGEKESSLGGITSVSAFNKT